MLEVDKLLWTEKYRPHDLESIVLPEKTRNLIEKYRGEGVIPNLFLCSPPGQGKTSLAKLLARNVFDVDYLYVNASDENNVDTVRNKISEFARTASLQGSFKIVILDECDNFASVSSQKMLRALMEEVSDTTRFILTANYSNKVIDPIKSRCVELDIVPDIAGVAKRLYYIMQQEGLTLKKEQGNRFLEMIKRFFPDVRNIISHLQNSVDKDGNLDIEEYSTPAEFLNSILSMVLENKPIELRKFIIENELQFGGNYVNLLNSFFRFIIENNSLDNARKAKWTIILADYCSRFSNAIDPELNASACLFTLCE